MNDKKEELTKIIVEEVKRLGGIQRPNHKFIRCVVEPNGLQIVSERNLQWFRFVATANEFNDFVYEVKEYQIRTYKGGKENEINVLNISFSEDAEFDQY